MSVRQRVRANLHAHLVEDHGWATTPRPVWRRPFYCPICWVEARGKGNTRRAAWRHARSCEDTRGRGA